MAELEGVPPDIEIVAACFQVPYARCSHLYFTGTGRARLHAMLLEPVDPTEPHPAVLQFHGYSGHSGDWSQRLGYVALGHTPSRRWTVAVRLACRSMRHRCWADPDFGHEPLPGIDDAIFAPLRDL